MKRLTVFFVDAAISIAIIALLGVTARRCSPVKGPIIVTDSVTVYDTIPVLIPTPVDSTVIKYVTITLPTVTETPKDSTTIVTPDSVQVQIPITQKEYKDSNYHAWVSGYMPSLDSLHIYQQTKTITSIQREKQKRWGFGINAGVGIVPGGIEPCIVFGLHYNLFSW